MAVLYYMENEKQDEVEFATMEYFKQFIFLLFHLRLSKEFW